MLTAAGGAPAPGPSRRRAAVLGSPVGHSLSPALHRAAYAALGLDGWSYEAHEVTAEQLPGFLDGLDPSWVGLSLTMPLKQAVLPLLDRSADEGLPGSAVDEAVAATGSCNTLVRARTEGWRGHNTDVRGIVAAVREATPGTDPSPGDVARLAVLGGGATAASAVVAGARLGAVDLTVAVREPGRAHGALAAAAAAGLVARVVRLGTAAASAAVLGADLAVCTLPPGAADPLAALVADGPVPRGSLLDVVYEPWPTPLAAAWSAAGRPVVPGDAMLLHQAADQVRLMTGCEPPVAAMRAGMAAERAARLARAGETD